MEIANPNAINAAHILTSLIFYEMTKQKAKSEKVSRIISKSGR